jgi:hypothetical protein
MVHATNVVGNNSNSRVATKECDILIIASALVFCCGMYSAIRYSFFKNSIPDGRRNDRQ